MTSICRHSPGGRPGSRRARAMSSCTATRPSGRCRRGRGGTAGTRDDARSSGRGVRPPRRRCWRDGRPLARWVDRAGRDLAPDRRARAGTSDTGEVYGIAFHLRARADLPICERATARRRLTTGRAEAARRSGSGRAADPAARGGSADPRRPRAANGPRARSSRPSARSSATSPGGASPRAPRAAPEGMARRAPGRRRRDRAGRWTLGVRDVVLAEACDQPARPAALGGVEIAHPARLGRFGGLRLAATFGARLRWRGERFGGHRRPTTFHGGFDAATVAPFGVGLRFSRRRGLPRSIRSASGDVAGSLVRAPEIAPCRR